MIEVSLSTLILLYCTLPLAIVFLLWFKAEWSKPPMPYDQEVKDVVLECKVCGNVFVKPETDEGVVKCPQCENFFRL